MTLLWSETRLARHFDHTIANTERLCNTIAMLFPRTAAITMAVPRRRHNDGSALSRPHRRLRHNDDTARAAPNYLRHSTGARSMVPWRCRDTTCSLAESSSATKSRVPTQLARPHDGGAW